jgi:uncharacterized protein
MGLPSTEPVELERSMEMEVKSPCNGICTLDVEDICKGCRRTKDEISRWYILSSSEKQQIKDRIQIESL